MEIFQLPVSGQTVITGTWELVYVAPIYMEDTDPRGISNIRLHFLPNGKLFSIQPEEILSDSMESVDYKFELNKLTINPAGKEPYNIQIAFTDSNTMVFTSELSSDRIFKRMRETNAALKKIEPKSIQLVNTGDSLINSDKEITYDDSDYSNLSFNERITGVWEVIEYQNVPTHEMPPYGFLNDIWNINTNEIKIFKRINNDTSSANYKIINNEGIILTAPDGSQLFWKISFNQWGQLILGDETGAVILKLVTKNPRVFCTIPLKVVLLKLKGEK